jgi:hypothetical protein
MMNMFIRKYLLLSVLPRLNTSFWCFKPSALPVGPPQEHPHPFQSRLALGIKPRTFPEKQGVFEMPNFLADNSGVNSFLELVTSLFFYSWSGTFTFPPCRTVRPTCVILRTSDREISSLLGSLGRRRGVIQVGSELSEVGFLSVASFDLDAFSFTVVIAATLVSGLSFPDHL